MPHQPQEMGNFFRSDILCFLTHPSITYIIYICNKSDISWVDQFETLGIICQFGMVSNWLLIDISHTKLKYWAPIKDKFPVSVHLSWYLHLTKISTDTTLFELQKCYGPFWKTEFNWVVLCFLKVPPKSTPSTSKTDLKKLFWFF